MSAFRPDEPDEVRQTWHVRACENRIAVHVTRTWYNVYVSYYRLVDGADWSYVEGSAVGLGDRDPLPLAALMYNAALKRFGPKGDR